MQKEYTFLTNKQLNAYSDPLRHKILGMLITKALSGSEISRILKIPRQRVHYHLNILKEAELVYIEKEEIIRGLRTIYYKSVSLNFRLSTNNLQEDNIIDYPKKMKTLVSVYLNQIIEDIKNRETEYSDKKYLGIQNKVNLTYNQLAEIKQDFINISNKLIELTKINQTNSNEELIPMRITILGNPIDNPDD